MQELVIPLTPAVLTGIVFGIWSFSATIPRPRMSIFIFVILGGLFATAAWFLYTVPPAAFPSRFFVPVKEGDAEWIAWLDLIFRFLMAAIYTMVVAYVTGGATVLAAYILPRMQRALPTSLFKPSNADPAAAAIERMEEARDY